MRDPLFTLLCLFLALTVILPPAQAQRKKKRRSPARGVLRAQGLPPKEYITTALPEASFIENGVYMNPYFGLEVTVPSGWTALDDDSSKQFNQRGGELMAGDSPELKKMLEQGRRQTVNLFTLIKPLPAESGGSNSGVTVIAVAEPVPAFVRNGEEYVTQVKLLLESAAVKPEFDGPITKETIGGVEFATQQLRITHLGLVVRQKLSATIRLEHAIVLTRAYTTDRGAEVLDEVLRTIKFK